jgi:DNA-binding response OmpR family regulator
MIDPYLFAMARFIIGCSAEVSLKATVLVIEDDPAIAELIGLYLRKDGITTVTADTGEKGLAAFDDVGPDLVVLDINLPGMDGYEVLQALRRIREVPVILVTARQEDEDAILGFGMGADDYVTKPFSPKVLAARIRMHLSRARKAPEGGTSGTGEAELRFGPFVLNSRSGVLFRNGEKLALSPREVALLVHMTANPNVPMSSEDLYRNVWGRQYGDLSTVSVHIQRIRKKIEENPSEPRWIKTAHGRGYVLDPEGLP